MFVSKRLTILLFIFASCLLLLTTFLQLAQAAPQAVEITSFTATANGNDNTVELELKTGLASNIDHWRIQRAATVSDFVATGALDLEADTIPVKLDDGTITKVIPFNSALNATYTFTDTDNSLTAGDTWCYTIIEVLVNNTGSISHHDQDEAPFFACVTIGEGATYGVEMTSVSGDITSPGGTVTHTLTVTNTGTANSTNADIEFDLTFKKSSDDGWSETFDGNALNGTSNPAGAVETISLAPGASKTFVVNTTAPDPLNGATSSVLAVSIANSADSSATAQTSLTSESATYGVSVSIVAGAVISPGQTAMHSLTITNTGNAASSEDVKFNLTFKKSSDDGWSETFDGNALTGTSNPSGASQTVSIAPGTSATFTVAATAPDPLNNATSSTLNIEVVNAVYASATASTSVTSQADDGMTQDEFFVYIPIVLKP